jgi:hypothetical protein
MGRWRRAAIRIVWNNDGEGRKVIGAPICNKGHSRGHSCYRGPEHTTRLAVSRSTAGLIAVQAPAETWHGAAERPRSQWPWPLGLPTLPPQHSTSLMPCEGRQRDIPLSSAARPVPHVQHFGAHPGLPECIAYRACLSAEDAARCSQYMLPAQAHLDGMCRHLRDLPTPFSLTPRPCLLEHCLNKASITPQQ